MDNTFAELLRLILHLSILKQGSFTLAGGQPTSCYFDGRRLSLHPEGAQLLGQVMLPLIRVAGARAGGGSATGALPSVAALTLASTQDSGPPLTGFYTRKEAKGYGSGQVIEVCWTAGQPVALVDDVMLHRGFPGPGHRRRRSRRLPHSQGSDHPGPPGRRQRPPAPGRLRLQPPVSH